MGECTHIVPWRSIHLSIHPSCYSFHLWKCPLFSSSSVIILLYSSIHHFLVLSLHHCVILCLHPLVHPLLKGSISHPLLYPSFSPSIKLSICSSVPEPFYIFILYISILHYSSLLSICSLHLFSPVHYLPQKCSMGYEVTTLMMMKALAMATATSVDGYDISTSWLTVEPNDMKPHTPALGEK